MPIQLPRPLVSRRFLLLLALGSWALCAGYAALVVGTASWADARRLDALFPYYGWHIRFFNPEAWQHLQRGLAALALGLAGAGLALGPGTRAGRRELSALESAGRQLGRRVAGQWRALSAPQRQFLWGNLLLLTAVRVYLSVATPWADDAVSFEFFVRQRLLAVAAYYPLPNNHILANTLAWGFYQLHPTFWWSMRLPVLLTSTLGSGLLFMGVLRRLGYWPALLAAGAMSWVQLSLSHAAAGRGYWLVVVMATTMFLAVLALLAADAAPPPGAAGTQRVEPGSLRESGPAASPALAWAALVGAGLLGSYAVPTFAYVLASAFSWLALRALLTRRWALLATTGALALVAALGALLLYTPTLFVSGPGALLHNPYVEQLSAAAFWRSLPAHVWYTEGYLLGQRHVGAGLTVSGLALFAHLWRRGRAGQLPPALARQVRELGLPALWFGGAPYAVLLVQRVLPPERTLLYKSWFFFLLAALVLAGWRGAWTPTRRRLVGVGAGLFVLYQLATQLRYNHNARAMSADHRAVYAWLGSHPEARPALIPDLYLWAWLRFESHIEAPGKPYQADQLPRPGRRYRCLVVRASSPAPGPAEPRLNPAAATPLPGHSSP